MGNYFFDHIGSRDNIKTGENVAADSEYHQFGVDYAEGADFAFVQIIFKIESSIGFGYGICGITEFHPHIYIREN